MWDILRYSALGTRLAHATHLVYWSARLIARR